MRRGSARGPRTGPSGGGRLLAAAALLASSALLTPAVAYAQEPSTAEDAEAVALEAVAVWLALLDAGEYEATWQQAAEAFRSAVTLAAWKQSVTSAVGPFAPLGERTLLAVTFYVDPPNAPPGEYVVIQYRTEASGDRSVIETVSPMKDPDGVWRVSGYYIAPDPG